MSDDSSFAHDIFSLCDIRARNIPFTCEWGLHLLNDSILLQILLIMCAGCLPHHGF